MSKIIVEIMPKPEILDPQGKAVAGVLQRLGHEQITGVRIGKRFEVEVDGEVSDELLSKVAEVAADVFSNPVIEDVVSVAAAKED
ncbi:MULTISPECIES: phosphoribosylformylglycinamidine synthase subunit PurS [unclassified Pseudoclavibacter]|uniref:phosphoribosylformylglycinamidine synthase subunit PurS n=1 Tax=unclassified Pseudoclavibacter TaxID=2615177 RepID=UPI001300EB0B|nr:MULTISPECIES: phosphoribosylformylglycinamidine synthase subunit PurS [unclassified Pseudoclavibacter]KAB1644431.1 phosphoribosylformylglycinamidine synthase subunit PurS [Pseudoclavibacter sp. CFCC 14310]KAB1659058.1 phosphoribosylformylglycinamidine synthase subunit PurS [Pseudoclavibacter sp. CFCC 11306]KAB1660963.1 phosphoribosylformylglycinamidine synthase subunit PurS [Pseudoclavibacter sp. CFCC 13796]KAB1664066.1 phosphoribosylformylglycinamidine synthase subunit PurS [Pseudoclavibact